MGSALQRASGWCKGAGGSSGNTSRSRRGEILAGRRPAGENSPPGCARERADEAVFCLCIFAGQADSERKWYRGQAAFPDTGVSGKAVFIFPVEVQTFMKFTEEVFSQKMAPITGSAIRDIFKLLGKPGMISFAGGNPSNAALEPDVIAPIAEKVVREHGRSLLQYGGTEGFMPLRESAAAFLNTSGVKCTAENILPTQGSTQAIDLLLKALVDPGDTVLCESPTFLGTIQAMHTYGANIVSVPTDECGMIPEAAEEAIKKYRPKLLYVIPTFQNPTGVTLTLERRRMIAALGAKYGVVIAEDDPYRDLRYRGEALPSIQSFDEEGWVVYLSSFSKLISPGMRVGCAVVKPAALMRKMVIGKQSTDVHSPLITQAIIDDYLRRGLLPAHIRQICGFYQEQLDAMLEGFRLFPQGTAHTTPEGGLFVWASLPEHIDALNLLNKAVEKGVAFVPGVHFYPEGGHKNTLRLNFSNAAVPQINEGMARLAETIAECM